jgi:hypothetical protein
MAGERMRRSARGDEAIVVLVLPLLDSEHSGLVAALLVEPRCMSFLFFFFRVLPVQVRHGRMDQRTVFAEMFGALCVTASRV